MAPCPSLRHGLLAPRLACGSCLRLWPEVAAVEAPKYACTLAEVHMRRAVLSSHAGWTSLLPMLGVKEGLGLGEAGDPRATAGPGPRGPGPSEPGPGQGPGPRGPRPGQEPGRGPGARGPGPGRGAGTSAGVEGPLAAVLCLSAACPLPLCVDLRCLVSG